MPRGRSLSGGSRGRLIQGARRLTSWELGPGGTTELLTTAAGAFFVGSVTSPLVPGLTMVRLRGKFNAFLKNVSGAIGDGFSGAFGIGIATDAAVAIGITAVPTPITEQAWNGWLYWRAFYVHAATAVFSDGVNSPLMMQDFEVDSKAMRKIAIEESIYAVIATS